jgi:ketosteroid isomerase-like protein
MSDLKQLARNYFETFSRMDINGLEALFSDDIVLRDWEHAAIGKVDVITSNQNLFQRVTSIQVDPVQIYQDENTVAAELIVTINNEIRLLVTDVITFTGDKISSIRAYKG